MHIAKANRIAIIDPPSHLVVMRDMYSSTISKLGYSWPNVDLICISGQLKADFEVKIFDFNSVNISREAALRKLIDFSPTHAIFAFGESVGLSDLSFAKHVKEEILPKEGLIFGTGGSLIHESKKYMEENFWLDGIITNYVYSGISELLLGSTEVDNVFYRNRKQGDFFWRRADPKMNFELPAGLHSDLNLQKYFIPQLGTSNLTSIATSWGCPYKCSFCVSSTLNYRVRSASSIFEEIKYCVTIGINSFFFRDNVFGINEKQLFELSELIKASRLPPINFISDARIDTITSSKLNSLKAFGRVALNFGIESQSKETLSHYQKGLKKNNVSDLLGKCREAGIINTGYFILGLPGENITDVKSTIYYSKMLPIDFASFNLPLPIKGTALRENSIRDGLIQASSNGYDGRGEMFIASENLSHKKLKKMQRVAFISFYFRPKLMLKILQINFSVSLLFRLGKSASSLIFKLKK